MRSTLGFVAVFALGAALGGNLWAEDVKPPEPAKKTAPGSFLERFLTPRVSSRLTGEAIAAMAFADPTANPWTRDRGTVTRIERGAVSAATGAVREYFLESMQLSTIAVPVPGGLGGRTSSGGMKVRFTVAHFIPRADLSIPSAHGNVRFSADLRGRMSTGFETHDSKFGVDMTIDPVSRDASFGLGCRF